MRVSFSTAIRRSEEEMVLEACGRLGLDDEATGYVLWRWSRSRYLLDLVHALGGTVGDYVEMTIQARAPEPGTRLMIG